MLQIEIEYWFPLDSFITQHIINHLAEKTEI